MRKVLILLNIFVFMFISSKEVVTVKYKFNLPEKWYYDSIDESNFYIFNYDSEDEKSLERVNKKNLIKIDCTIRSQQIGSIDDILENYTSIYDTIINKEVILSENGITAYSFIAEGIPNEYEYFIVYVSMNKSILFQCWPFDSIYKNDFIKIVKSFKFIYYAPKTDSLRFRDSPTSDGKIIRKLVKGEKLELIEKGKSEKIGDATGTWVKVRTNQGEEGWCFDAYLEEVKE